MENKNSRKSFVYFIFKSLFIQLLLLISSIAISSLEINFAYAEEIVSLENVATVVTEEPDLKDNIDLADEEDSLLEKDTYENDKEESNIQNLQKQERVTKDEKTYEFKNEVEAEELKEVSSLKNDLGIVNVEVQGDEEQDLLVDNNDILNYSLEESIDISAIVNEINIMPDYITGNLTLKGARLDNGSNYSLYFESGDTKYDTYIIYNGNGNYYFDRNISGIEKDKKYNFAIYYGNKKYIVEIPSTRVTGLNGYEAIISNNIISFEKEKPYGNITELRYENDYLIGNMNSNIKITSETLLYEDELGNTLNTFVSDLGNGNYYFDRNVAGFDKSKKYSFVILVDGKKYKVDIHNGRLKSGEEYDVDVIGNNIIYTQKPIFAEVKDIRVENNYIIGNIRVNRSTLDGIQILLQSEDLEESETFVIRSGEYDYYFDRNIEGYDLDKKYNIIIAGLDGNYIVKIPDGKLGHTSEYDAIAVSDTIVFEKFKIKEQIIFNIYDITAKDDYLMANGSIYNNVIYGPYSRKEDFQFSKIALVSEDGREYYETFLIPKGNFEYYFDRNIYGIDKGKKYNFLLYSDNDEIIANIPNSRIGKIGEYDVFARDNNIEFEEIDIAKVMSGVYGKSEKGRDLEYYRIGRGDNVAFMTFAMHGFEDNFDHDGRVLVEIADYLKDNLRNPDVLNNWTVYIFRKVNPDGVEEGYTRNGPGRTTVVSRIDLNRQWQAPGDGYKKYYNGRNYNGDRSFIAPEAYHLRDFIFEHMSKVGKNYVVDTHGWLNGTYGDDGLGSYYRNEFGMQNHNPRYGTQYFSTWAKKVLPNCRAVLVELPNVWSIDQARQRGFHQKHLAATEKMLLYA